MIHISYCTQKNNTRPYTKKITSFWVTGLNVIPKNTKIQGENIRRNLCFLGLGKDFLDMKPITWSIKEIIDKVNFFKIKNFHSSADTA